MHISHKKSIYFCMLLGILEVAVQGCRSEKSFESDGKSTTPLSKQFSSSVALRVEDGANIELSQVDLTHGGCFFFVGTDCPISNAYAPELGRIASEFEKEKLSFHIVYVVRDLDVNSAAEHAKAYGYRGSIVLDRELRWARTLGVTHMPEAVVLSPKGEIIYQGRIDDRYPAAGGKRREHPTSFDLRDALSAFVRRETINHPRTKPVGCPVDYEK